MIYSISSTDQFRLQKECDKLIKELNILDEDVYKFDATNISEGDLLQELCTSSLFGQKCIVISHPVFLSNDYKFSYESDFINFFSSPSDDIIVILLIDFFYDKNNSLIKLISNQNKIVNLVDLNDSDLTSFINSIISEDGYEIENVALEELLRRTMKDTLSISNEIDKLKMYCDNKKITFKDVSDLVITDIDNKIYELTNFYFEKNTKKLMQTYYDIVKYQTTSFDIHSSIVNAFNNSVTMLVQTKHLVKKGLSKNDIADFFKVKPGKAHYMVLDSKKFSEKKLISLIDRLAKLDLQLKSTMIDKVLAVELFLLENE